jgi:DNA-binding winged helix-turn-helix (wHTH) protein/Tfp pilus assembly protein PilF
LIDDLFLTVATYNNVAIGGDIRLIEAQSVQIDLSRERPFALASMTVVPSFRQVKKDGASETLEPRVMQVLVALAQKEGGIVGRDELISRCWDGRIVGENSINRVISLLRQLLARVGGEGYAIETITKVGYRLTTPELSAESGGAFSPQAHSGNSSRRNVVTGLAGVAAVAGVGAASWSRWRTRPSAHHETAAAFYQRGLELQKQGDDNAEQAIVYFDRAVRADPDFPEAWGAVALARARLAPPGDAASPRELERVRSTAARALALDPHNKDATLALVIVAPYWRNWGVVERDARAALQMMPEVVLLHAKLGSVLSHVGRFKEGLIELRKAVEREPLVPAYQLFLWRALWGAGRVGEARSLIDGAWACWRDDMRIWSSRFTLLAFSGDVAGMMAMSQRGSVGRSDANPLPIDLGLACARAFASDDAGAKRATAATVSAAAASGRFAPWLAIPMLSGLGAVELAFAESFEFFFGKRDALTGERELAPTHDPRMTFQLFLPPAAAMRSDPRFDKLTAAIGLNDYWRDSGSRPDFRTA